MSACPKCGFPLSTQAYDCSGCGIILAKYKGPHTAPGPGAHGYVDRSAGEPWHPRGDAAGTRATDTGAYDLAAPSYAAPSYAPIMGQGRPSGFPDPYTPSTGRRWAPHIAIGLFVAGGIVGGIYWLAPKSFPKLTLEAAAVNSEGADPCAGRRRCVVVVVAPWCGACKVGMPVIKELAQRWSGTSSIGFKPIVALAPKAQCEQMAREIGGQTFLDPLGRMLRAVGESTVPHWFVVDPGGKIKHHSGGLVPDTLAQIDRLGLSKLDAEDRAK